MKDGRKLEKLEKYLQGQMSELESSEFDSLLQKNQSWRELLERYKIMSSALEYQMEKELIEELKEQDTNFQLLNQTAAIRRIPLSVYQLATIAAAFLVLFVTLFWYQQSYYSDAALVNQYYQLPLSQSSRMPSPDGTNYSEGTLAFSDGDWASAIEHFENIRPSAGEYGDAQFYLGHAYFNNGDYNASLQVFQSLDQEQNIHEEAIEWMIILSMLKTENDDSLILLELDRLMTNGNHAFFKNATELKDKLKSFWRIF